MAGLCKTRGCLSGTGMVLGSSRKKSPSSRIPRWCSSTNDENEKRPFDLEQSLGHADFMDFFEEDPTPLKETELKEVWKVKAQRKDVDDQLHEAQAHIDFLKRRLREVKEAIETITRKLDNPQLDPSQLASNEEDCQKFLDSFAKEQIRLQRDLLANVDLEEKLIEDLAKAQKNRWEAEVEKEIFSNELEEKANPTMTRYRRLRAAKLQRRVANERRIKENAEKLKSRTLDRVVNSIKSNILASDQKPLITELKLHNAVTARRKVQAHIKRTIKLRHEKRLLESYNHRMIQDRQHRLLSHLKMEIDNQKDNLIATQLMKQRKASMIAREKVSIQEALVKSGRNPFYVEHLLSLEEKRMAQQKRILEKEQERLAELHREFEVIERSKKLEEHNKKKWDKFWARKLEARKKAARLKDNQFLHVPYGLPPGISAVGSQLSPAKEIDAENEMLHYTNLKLEPTLEEKLSVEGIAGEGSEEGKEGNDKETEEEAKKRSLAKSNASSSSKKSKKKSKKSTSLKKKSSSRKMSKKEQRASKDSRTGKKSRKSILRRGNSEHASLPGESNNEEFYGFGTLMDNYENEEDPEEEFDNRKFSSPHTRSPSLPSGSSVKELYISEQQQRKSKPRNMAIREEFSFGYERESKFRNKAKQKKATSKNRISFLLTPKEVVFSDYEVGRSYRQTVTVTNISTERVKFFMKDILDVTSRRPNNIENVDQIIIPELQETIQVNCGVSRFLSPGLCHEIVLIFQPPLLEDWKGVIRFHSNLEPFEIRVECRKKRFSPIITPGQLNFTNTVVNTTGRMNMSIKNTGARPGVIGRIFQPSLEEETAVIVVEAAEEESTAEEETTTDMHQSDTTTNTIGFSEINSALILKEKIKINPSNSKSPRRAVSASETKSQKKIKKKKNLEKKAVGPSKEAVDSAKGILGQLIDSILNNVFLAYVKECNRDLDKNMGRTICVLFRPQFPGIFKTTFEIEFEDPEEVPLMFEVSGTCIENPIFAEPLNTDFRICMMDHNYQEMITICTTIPGAGKVTPKIPPELKPYVKVVPPQATVFKKSPGKFSVKFSPSRSMLDNNSPALKFIDRDTGIIDFPVFFDLKFPFKTDSPLQTTFLGVLTNQNLEFYPSHEIDMGKCSSTETVLGNFSIFNNSMLPQHLGFVDVPECITIQPNFGFATLLPFEKRDFEILLSMSEHELGEVVYLLKCRTKERREYYLRVKAVAKISHIHLSQPRILFPLTPVGTIVHATIDIFSDAPDIHHDRYIPRMAPKFHFSIDPGIPIKVYPEAGFIKNGERKKILVEFQPEVSDRDVQVHLVGMLQKQFIQREASLQRELDGIDQAIEYAVSVLENDEAENDIANNVDGGQVKFGGGVYDDRKNSENMGPTKSEQLSNEKRSSFVKAAPIQSEVRVSLPSQVMSLMSVKSGYKSELDVTRTKSRKTLKFTLALETDENEDPPEQRKSLRKSQQSQGSTNGPKTEEKKSRKKSNKSQIGKTSPPDGGDNEGRKTFRKSEKSQASTNGPKTEEKKSRKKSNKSQKTSPPEGGDNEDRERKTLRKSEKSQGSSKQRKSSTRKKRLSKVTRVLTEHERVHRELIYRREKVVNLLAVPFTAPAPESIDTKGKEFMKAKKDLLKNLLTSSSLYKIPCFVTDDFEESEMLLLHCKCPVSNPSLILLEESPTIDFGTVAIGSQSYMEVHLYNVSQAIMKLKMDIINPYGPFIVCNSLRRIPPDHVFTLKLRFRPEDSRSFRETVQISGGDSRFTLILLGEGVAAPELNV